MIELPKKKDKFGLGNQPSFKQTMDQKADQGKVPSIQEVSSKVGFQSHNQVNAIGDKDQEMSKIVFQGPLDVALTNWKATYIPEIISCSK